MSSVTIQKVYPYVSKSRGNIITLTKSKIIEKGKLKEIIKEKIIKW